MGKHDPFPEPSDVDILADPDGLELEALGAAIYDPEGTLNVLKPDHFSCPKNAALFAASVAVHARGERVDAETLLDELRQTGVLAKLWQDVRDFSCWWATRYFASHKRCGAELEVLEDARLRTLRECGRQIAAAAERREPHVAVAHAERAAKVARWAPPQIQKKERVA